MAVSLDQFVQQLIESGLMSATEVTSFQRELPADRKPKDAEGLARELVQAKRLTKYQAQAVYQGKGKGLVLDQYVVLDKLGQGGMGVVLKAEHRKMKRLVAIKMISPAAMKSPEAVKRFYREVEAVAKLSHANIVAAYDANEHAGLHYLVMEYVEGKDLAAILKQRGPLPIGEAVEYISQVARGLDYAHQHGIIHRDIKPANLLLDRKGTIRILDMGVARVQQGLGAGGSGIGEDDRLTESGQVMGTGDYMAPEQALDTHRADARSDVYSLGCTLYRLLTGKTPYQGETFAQLFLAHRDAPIPSLRDERPDVPAGLDAVFQQMIAKEPGDRQQTMAEVIEALRCFAGGSEETRDGERTMAARQASLQGAAMAKTAPWQVAAPARHETMAQQRPVEPTTQFVARLGRAMKRRKLVAAASGGLLLAVVVLSIVIIRIKGREGRQTTVQVLAGSQVSVSKDGRVDVTLRGEGLGVRDSGFGDKKVASQPPLSKPPIAASQVPVPHPHPPTPKPQLPTSSPFVGPDGNWKLPPGAPPPAIGPFDAKKAFGHQEAWATYLGVAVEETNSIGMELVFIPPGEFDMGSTAEEQAWAIKAGGVGREETFVACVSSEGPRHRVKITKPFYLGKYPVTQGEYEKLTGTNPSAFTEKQLDASKFNPPPNNNDLPYRTSVAKKVAGKDTSRHPVETVNWDEATVFCRRLSAILAERAVGHVYRLPTEAEWEYACRAGTTTRWYCGDDEAGLQEYGWFSKGTTHPVGEKKANGWALFDMHGNVGQWCLDWFSLDYYRESPTIDPTGPPQVGTARVSRGNTFIRPPALQRSAWRKGRWPPGHSCTQGFRVAVEIEVKAERKAESRTGETGRLDEIHPRLAPSAQSTTTGSNAAQANQEPNSAQSKPVRTADLAPTSVSSLSQQQSPPPKPGALSAPAAAPKQRLPVPTEAALEQARKAADALFRAEVEKARSSADRVALAKRRLAQALGGERGSADQYVLMITAQNLATAARDAETAFQAIDHLGEAFEVDRFAIKTGILADWAKDARTPDARRRVVQQILDVGDEALDAGHLDAARELGKLATGKLSGMKDKDLAQKLKDYRKRFTEAGKDAEELKEAQATLSKDPKDLQANLVVGRYLCFTKGDWKNGIRLLALGSDETLKALANRELTSPPTKPDEQVALADGWWESASNRTRSQMNAIKVHAGLWYRQAVAGLAAGLVRNNVEKRLAEVNKLRSQLAMPPLAIAPFDSKKAKQHQEAWAHILGLPVEQTNSIGMKLVLIPPGEFDMGSSPEEQAWAIKARLVEREEQYNARLSSEGPRHRVKITKPFCLAMYPVTQGEYEKITGTNPSSFTEKQMDLSKSDPLSNEKRLQNRRDQARSVAGKDTSRHPVEMVNWAEATEFCRRLSATPGERAARRVYRLPTEAEWEYACRAGTTTRWYCGDDEAGLLEVAWFGKNFGMTTHPVGEKKPNAWGLFDMHGVFCQWCSDGFSPDFYKQSPTSDPVGPRSVEMVRVLRGGSGDSAGCRSASRKIGWAPYRGSQEGFRVVANVSVP